MPLESATYVSDLNANNPEADDPRSQGDDQLRLIKSCLKASLPVDLRDVSSAAEGEILVFNSNGRPENKASGSTLIVDTSLALTSSYADFSGNTETRDNLGLWTSGSPTRFTAPESMNLMVMVHNGSWTGKTSGLDFLLARFRINGGSDLIQRVAVHQAAATMPSIVFPWKAAAADYLEIALAFDNWETGDSGITLSNTNVVVWRQF